MTAFDTSVLPYEERLHWLTRKDWPAGRVTHSSFIVVAALWGFGIAWTAIIGTIATINREKVAASFATNWTESLGVIAAFGLGILVIILAIAATVSWLKNGRSTLVIETLPAFAGGRFRGVIEAGDILAGKTSFKLTLACEEVISRTERIEGSRRRKHSHFDRMLRGSATARIMRPATGSAGEGFSLPIDIAIPGHLPGSRHLSDGTGYQWTLSISSDDGASPAFGAAFEVPVYREDDLVPQA